MLADDSGLEVDVHAVVFDDDGNGVYTGDPAFADDGYHLTTGSAAIDRGVNAGITTDIDGDPRPLDGDLDGVAATDLGADEFGFRINLPVIFKNFGS